MTRGALLPKSSNLHENNKYDTVIVPNLRLNECPTAPSIWPWPLMTLHDRTYYNTSIVAALPTGATSYLAQPIIGPGKYCYFPLSNQSDWRLNLWCQLT